MDMILFAPPVIKHVGKVGFQERLQIGFTPCPPAWICRCWYCANVAPLQRQSRLPLARGLFIFSYPRLVIIRSSCSSNLRSSTSSSMIFVHLSRPERPVFLMDFRNFCFAFQLSFQNRFSDLHGFFADFLFLLFGSAVSASVIMGSSMIMATLP